MTEHTTLKLQIYEHGSSRDVGIESVDGVTWVANDIERGIASRIVACVNACAGVPTDQLSRLSPPDTLAAAVGEAVKTLRWLSTALSMPGYGTYRTRSAESADRLAAAIEQRGR